MAETNWILVDIHWVFNWLTQSVGAPLAILVAVVVTFATAVFLLWWFWEDLVRKPGAPRIIAWIRRKLWDEVREDANEKPIDVVSETADSKPIQAYFIPGYTESFNELCAIISSQEAWKISDHNIENNDATRVLLRFRKGKVDNSTRYIFFIDLVESERSRGDTSVILDLIREVRGPGHNFAFKPIFVFFSREHELISAFESLRPPEIGAELKKKFFRLEPTEVGATMRERLRVLHRKVAIEWGMHCPEAGPNPL